MEKHIYIFGNGNLSFSDFEQYYLSVIRQEASDPATSFLIGDFRGTDTLAMELLKNLTPRVTVLHIGERPRYFPDKFRTNAGNWSVRGGFQSDTERDEFAIAHCTHFIAVDFNSDSQRTSGTLRNMHACLNAGKTNLTQKG